MKYKSSSYGLARDNNEWKRGKSAKCVSYYFLQSTRNWRNLILITIYCQLSSQLVTVEDSISLNGREPTDLSKESDSGGFMTAGCICFHLFSLQSLFFLPNQNEAFLSTNNYVAILYSS